MPCGKTGLFKRQLPRSKRQNYLPLINGCKIPRSLALFMSRIMNDCWVSRQRFFDDCLSFHPVSLMTRSAHKSQACGRSIKVERNCCDSQQDDALRRVPSRSIQKFAMIKFLMRVSNPPNMTIYDQNYFAKSSGHLARRGSCCFEKNISLSKSSSKASKGLTPTPETRV